MCTLWVKLWRCNHIKIETTKTREQPKIKHRINYRKKWKMQKCQNHRVPHHLIRAKIRCLDDQRCCGQSCQTPSSLSLLTKERSAAHLAAPLPHPLPESSGGREGYKAVFTLEKRKLSEISPSLWWRDCTELRGLPFRHHTNLFTKSFHPLRSWWEAVRCDSLFWWVENKFQTTI